MDQNPVLACMRAHRSVRAFTSAEVPREHIDLAVSSAQSAATSSWIQAYRLLHITRLADRQAVAKLAGDQTQIHQAGAFFCIAADNLRHQQLTESGGAEFQNNFEVFLTSTIDAALFAQNLVLAFESLGYGTCFIGALRNDAKGVARVLELPDHVYPLFGLCVGLPAEDPGLRPRLPLDAILNRDRVPSIVEQKEQWTRADEISARYYAERGQPNRTWSGGILRRFRALARENLPAAYRSMGARLE